jgi:hypothetical protein
MSVNVTYEISVSQYRDLYHAVRSYDMGPPTLISLRRKSCYGFLSPLAGYEPTNLGSNGKHNHH